MNNQRGINPTAGPSAMEPSTAALAPQSCGHCRQRKIRCDKSLPNCAKCVKSAIQCTYYASQRRGRPRTSATNTGNAPLTREEQLMKRIKRLETVIESLKGEATEEVGEDPLDPLRTQLGRLVVGKPYLNDSFWTSNEIKDILGESEEEEEDGEEDTEDSSPMSNEQDFIMGEVGTYEDLTMFHPALNQIQHYWQVYVDNCEVILRMMHEPTVAVVVEDAIRTNLESLSRSEELLMFAIYFAAVSSLPAKRCQEEFGDEQEVLLARYQLAIKHGLNRSRFLYTQDLKVLQAFVLYLTCLRHSNETHVDIVWTLLGLAIRIAQGMAIDRDGSMFKLSPYETEMRRRVWWHILLLDIRAGEGKGCFATRLAHDVQLPTNINESSLSVDTKEYLEPVKGVADLTIPIVRFSCGKLGRRLQASEFDSLPLSVEGKKKFVANYTKELTEKYLRHCDTAGPLFQYGSRTAKIITSRMNLIIFKGDTSGITPEDKEWLFGVALNILEYSNQLSKDHFATQWSWLLRTHVQWQAVALVLAELCVRSASPMTDRAWALVDDTKHEWVTQPGTAEDVLQQNVRKLLGKAQARRARQAEGVSQSQSQSPHDLSPHSNSNSGPEPNSDQQDMAGNYVSHAPPDPMRQQRELQRLQQLQRTQIPLQPQFPHIPMYPHPSMYAISADMIPSQSAPSSMPGHISGSMPEGLMNGGAPAFLPMQAPMQYQMYQQNNMWTPVGYTQDSGEVPTSHGGDLPPDPRNSGQQPYYPHQMNSYVQDQNWKWAA